MKENAYAEASRTLNNHDSSRPFILCVDQGSHTKIVCCAELGFISNVSSILIKNIVENGELSVDMQDEFIVQAMAHFGLSRWRMFGVALLALWRGPCRDEDCRFK